MTKILPFHTTLLSPWPVLMSISVMNLLMGMTLCFKKTGAITSMVVNFFIFFCIMYTWCRDTSRESSVEGAHTHQVYWGLKLGMIFFIVSEIFFFFSFFWGFFHFGLNPSILSGAQWPPTGIESINPYKVPLLNSIILISSGVTVTWSHHSLNSGDDLEYARGLTATIMLGAYFTFFQAIEFVESSFTFSDSAYGSIFFMGTSFHGLHVIMGSIFLMTTLLKAKWSSDFRKGNFLFFELSIWYWHFVDVIWMLLFIVFYWWPWYY